MLSHIPTNFPACSSPVCGQNLELFCSLPASFQAVTKYFLINRLFKVVPQQRIEFPLRVNASFLRMLPSICWGPPSSLLYFRNLFCQNLLNETPLRIEFNTKINAPSHNISMETFRTIILHILDLWLYKSGEHLCKILAREAGDQLSSELRACSYGPPW